MDKKSLETYGLESLIVPVNNATVWILDDPLVSQGGLARLYLLIVGKSLLEPPRTAGFFVVLASRGIILSWLGSARAMMDIDVKNLV